MKKRVVVLMLAGVMAMSSLTGCGSIKDSDVVATVGKDEITGDIANFYARYTQAQYETYYAGYLGEDMWSSGADGGATYEETVKEAVLKDLETMILLEQHMDDYKVALTEEEKNVIKEAAQEFDEANALEEKEKISGSSKTVERVMTLLAIQKKMTAAIQADVDTEVSDEEAAQKSMQYVLFSYESDTEDGKSEELSDEEKQEKKSQAESFAEGAKSAEDFSAYASEQGLEASTATFDSETATPAKELIEAADKLAEGEMTGVVETDKGCYVAKVTSLLDREATDSKKQVIVNDRKTELYNDVCDKWRKKADIDENKSVWKKIDFNDMSVTMKEQEQDPYADEVQTDDVAESQDSDAE